MPYIQSNLIARQHGWGDAAPATGQSVGAAIGGILQTLFGSNSAAPTAPVVMPAQDHTMLYLGLAGAAGIGLYLWKRKKR